MHRDDMLVGDMAEENVSDEDKPVNSVLLAKFLSKAAKVAVLFLVSFVFSFRVCDVPVLCYHCR